MHYVVELIGCDPQRLGFVEQLEPIVVAAAATHGATIVDRSFHQFEPRGASGTLLLAESHMSFHTWPERGYMSLDAFTCGAAFDARAAVEAIGRAIGADVARIHCLERGF